MSVVKNFKQAVAKAAKSVSLAWGGGTASPFGLQEQISASTTIGGIPVGNIRISIDSLYTIFRNHGDVFGCIRELGQSVGVAGWRWEDRTDKEKEANRDSVRRAEAILTSAQTMRQWLKEMIQDVEVAGNSYYHLERSKGTGEVISLCYIDPRTLSCVTNKYGQVLLWIQRTGTMTAEFTPEEIVHFKVTKDPNSPIFGMSPLEPILWELRTDLAAMVSNYALFMNDATPATMYVFENDMDDEQIRHAVDKLKEQLRGAENRHKAMGMKGLKEIQTVSITNKDMEFTTLRSMTTEKVCAAYGVPKSILGYTDDVNVGNMEEMNKKFWEGTIEPLEEQIAEFINRKLLPAMGIVDIRLCFETRNFDNREWDDQSTRADLQLGALTINELREIRGREPFDAATMGEFVDRPIIYSGMGAIPVEDIGADVIDEFTDPALVDEGAQEKRLRVDDPLRSTYDQKHKKKGLWPQTKK